MKPWRLVVSCLALLILCGCQRQLASEYHSVTPHEEQYEADLYSDALTVENYLGLRNAILSFIENGTDYGVVRIYTYEGDLTSDLANTVYDLWHNDPLGSYAVAHMAYDYTHIVSYYELYIYITFRVTKEQIDAITYCSDIADVEAAMEEALLTQQYQKTIRISNYQEFNPQTMLHRLFLCHPELGISEPECAFAFYPTSGIQRILEMDFTYPYDLLRMIARQNSLEERTQSLVSLISSYTRDKYRMQQIFNWIVSRVTYLGEDSQLFSSAYNTLCNEYANSQGISMAVQHLCNRMDIPCYIVEGQYMESPWFWNIVYYDDAWHHYDAAIGILEEQRVMPELFDSNMADYSWDTGIYPVCPAPPAEDEPDTPVDSPEDEPDTPADSPEDEPPAPPADAAGNESALFIPPVADPAGVSVDNIPSASILQNDDAPAGSEKSPAETP